MKSLLPEIPVACDLYEREGTDSVQEVYFIIEKTTTWKMLTEKYF